MLQADSLALKRTVLLDVLLSTLEDDTALGLVVLGSLGVLLQGGRGQSGRALAALQHRLGQTALVDGLGGSSLLGSGGSLGRGSGLGSGGGSLGRSSDLSGGSSLGTTLRNRMEKEERGRGRGRGNKQKTRSAFEYLEIQPKTFFFASLIYGMKTVFITRHLHPASCQCR